MLLRLSLILFLLVGLSLGGLGLVYLTADQFMPYHELAIQSRWSDLDPNTRWLLLGLLKGFGAGSLVAGLAVTGMTIASFRQSPARYRVLLPTVAVVYLALLTYATYIVDSNTPGNPPLSLSLAGLGVTLVATSLLLLGLRKPDTGNLKT